MLKLTVLKGVAVSGAQGGGFRSRVAILGALSGRYKRSSTEQNQAIFRLVSLEDDSTCFSLYVGIKNIAFFGKIKFLGKFQSLGWRNLVPLLYV